MKNIFIRVDASQQIGLGHLVRCIALAHMLKDFFQITFVCKEIPEQSVKEIKSALLGLIKINKEEDFFKKLCVNDIIVLDGYHFDTNYQRKIKEKVCKLVCIDDLHDKEFVADLIINHAPGIKPEDYQAQPYTLFALGLEYTLLRPAFLEQSKKYRKIDSIETVLICFGGSDYKNLTENTIKIVKEFKNFKQIFIVTGSAYYYLESLLKLTKSDSRIQHFHSIKENQMLDIMLHSDLAIVPASGILLEALASGCMVISGVYTENQKNIHHQFKRQKLIFDAGDFETDKIFRVINELLNSKKISIRNKLRISNNKVLKLFQQLSTSIRMNIRLVSKNDMELTYGWATNKKIRAHSFSKNLIGIEEHTKWFYKKINDKYCVYLIAEFDGTAIGSVRFDKENDSAKINYLLDPAYYGKGLGTSLLSSGIAYFIKNNNIKNINHIYGLVLKENIASIKAFQRLGFSQKKYKDYYLFKK